MMEERGGRRAMGTQCGGVSNGWLRAAAKAILSEIGIPDCSVGIFLLGNEEMRDIKFRATGERKRVVDVLAFAEPAAFPHPEVKNGIIGEVYINGERCRGDREQVIALLVHGILHLLNFCHDSKRDTIRMKRMEQRILRLFR